MTEILGPAIESNSQPKKLLSLVDQIDTLTSDIKNLTSFTDLVAREKVRTWVVCFMDWNGQLRTMASADLQNQRALTVLGVLEMAKYQLMTGCADE